MIVVKRQLHWAWCKKPGPEVEYPSEATGITVRWLCSACKQYHEAKV